MSDFRPLTGLYRSFLNGLPLVNAQIKVKLSKNDYDLEAGYPVLEETLITTDTGHIPANSLIWKTVRGLDGAKVVFLEPDGFKWEAAVPEGDTPISIQELRANGTVITPPETVLALIANTEIGDLKNVAFLDLTDGDAIVWDAAEQKFVNQQISGGGGGWNPGNQTANKVYAAPSGATGLPTFRLLVADDIPNLSADKITSGAFGTTRFANNAVTFAKVQNIATARILGRSTAAAGSVEEISIGSGLSLSGGVLSASGGGGGGIGGSGTTNYLPKFSGSATVADSAASDNATSRIFQIYNRIFEIQDATTTSEKFQITQQYGTIFSGDRESFSFGGIGQTPTIMLRTSPTNIFATNAFRLEMNCAIGNYGGVKIKSASGQAEKLFDLQNSSGTTIGGFSKNAGIIIAAMAEVDAENNTMFYSTDNARLVYKDSSGTVSNIT